MHLRPYTTHDRAVCLAIFQSNTPQYFDPAETAEFSEFLEHPDSPYFVVEEAGEVVGCGGYIIFQEKEIAGLVYGMVRRDRHKAGVGKFLLLARLRALYDHCPGIRVILDTSQHTFGFFEKVGFQVEQITEDFYGPGLHRYDMAMRLTAERCALLAGEAL